MLFSGGETKDHELRTDCVMNTGTLKFSSSVLVPFIFWKFLDGQTVNILSKKELDHYFPYTDFTPVQSNNLYVSLNKALQLEEYLLPVCGRWFSCSVLPVACLLFVFPPFVFNNCMVELLVF